MSDQFYRYLSKELFDYFDNNGLMKGDKFYIQFDENTQIINFYNSIKEYGINHFLFEEFSYKHNQGDEFLTYSVNCNGIKLVVVESTTISDDYLVTLRNQVGAQNGVWENTALLIIYDEAKDSIFNGMGNLANEGMPLNVNSISENLEDKITGSKTLNKPSKEIIRFYLKNIKEDIFQTTIWDYKNVLSIIESGKITPEDLYELKLFPDTNLKDYNAHKMQSRLKENFELFDEIETYRKYGDLNEELKKSFSERGVRVLKRDDWYLTDFKDIKDFKKKGVIQPLNYEENHDKKTEEGLIYWERPLSYTKAGMRKRHIIVFNENNSNIVTFNFAFDQHIKNEFLSSNSKKYASSSGKKLKVKFNVSNNEPTFKQISYKHNNQTNSYYIFNIVVLNASPAIFDSIKSRYTINLKKKRLIITNDENSDDVIFGSGSNLVEKDIEDTDEKIFLYDEDSILILESSPAWAEGSIKCELIYNDNTIPIEITEKSNKPVPVKSSVIWNLKRRNMENFTYNGAKAIQGVNSVYLEDNFKEFLDFESQIINDNIFYGIKEIDGSIKKQDIKFSPDLTNAYNAIFNYYKTFDDTPEDNLPSLVYLNDELKELYKNFLDIFNREISEIKDNDILADFEYKKDLVKIGRIDDDKRIMYSSLSPINIAYQLEISNQCGDDELSNNLAERLIPNNLIPYVYSDLNELYRPIHQDYAHEWLVYERSEDVSIGTTNVFISNVVNEKLTQFVKHFEYLFEVNNSSPLKINLININDDIEVVKGVFNFIRDRLPDKFKTKDVIPVEINIYTDSNKSSFETLFNCDSIDEVRDIFGIIIKSDLLDPIDILHLVQDNITYYHHKLTNEYEYAHISFYKVTSDVEPAYDSMDKMETGLSLNGLISSVASTTKHTDYRTGFGTRNVLDKENILVKSAININELIENSKNKGKNSYSKNRTVVTSITLDDENIEQLYDNSHWVTFIEPTFGIEYFENSNDVIIIHYSDQYTSSSKYDTITVTNEPTQYKKAIFKFLKEKRIYLKDEELNGIIRMFNSINGEWLLKIVSSSGEYDREKLSLISAAKYGLALLNHEDLIWIPISLEEILRITKNLKLDKAKGPISAFVKQGSYSDDLLFIGLNISDDENIKICYHPVEVKIGLNDAGVIKKGKSQIDSTYKLLYDLLNGNSSNFVNKFFRNFFIQLFLSTQQKLLVNEIWDEKHFERIEKFKPKLLNDEYEISYDLEEYIGKGSLFSFKTSCHHQSISSDNSIQIIEIPEEFAYGSLSKSVNDLFNEIQMGNSDIPVNDLLSNVNLDEIESKPYETEFSDESSNFDEDKNDVHVESVGDSIQEHYTDLNEHEDTFTEDSLDSDVADSVDELADFVFASVNRDKVICSLHDNDVLIPSEIASVTGIKSNNVSSLLTSLSDLGLVVCINPRYTVGRKYKLTSLGHEVYDKLVVLKETSDDVVDVVDSVDGISVDELADFVFASVNRDKVICSLHDNDVLIPSEIASVTGIVSNNVSSLLTSLSDLGLVVCINPRYTVGRKYKLTYLGHEVYDKLVVLKETSGNAVDEVMISDEDVKELADFVYASINRDKVICSLHDNDVLIPSEIASVTGIKSNNVSSLLTSLSDLGLVVCINPRYTVGRKYKLTYLGHEVYDKLVVLKETSDNVVNVNIDSNVDIDKVKNTYDDDTILKSHAYVSASNYREKVMNVLYGNDVLMPKQIAEYSDILPNHISKVLRELSDNNLIVCINPESRKGRLYKLTPFGNNVCNALRNSNNENSDEKTLSFDSTEVESSYDEDTILKSLAYVSASNYREKVMNVLYGNDVLMPKQIAEHSDIRSNHISKVLSELKNENIVECINPESRKGKLYKLTPLGVQIYNRLNNSDSISSDNDSIEIPHEELEIDRGSEVLIDIPDDGNNNVDNNDSTEHHIDLKDDVGLSKINNVSAADLKDVRALIGTAEDSNHEIYWEFGSPDINNRHMLIEGASGYGKSYFIQRMLKELSNQGIPSIIVDYTNGFKKSKLEPEFKESLEGRIEQHKVMFKKFPLNPFKKYLIEDDDEFIPEPDYNVAGRFKNIINTVYNFGDQQQMAIYNAVISGLSKYGDEMDLIKFKEELIKQDSTHATSTLSKLTQFLDINPFKTDDFDWSCLDEMDGKIRIIQLAGLSKDIQMVITEFVLLDLWNYKVNVGGEQHPFIVVLDEAQNLDFSEGSSSYNILKEGRKFGWSGWFATQFLKGAMKSDEINTLENANEKIYFHPTDNSISDIAIKLSKDGSDKKYWEQKLSKLNKGQAIVHGHLRNSDGKVYSARPVCVDISKIGIDKMEIDTNRDDNDLENTDLTNFKISDKVDSKEIYVDNNIDVDEISNDYFLELDDEFHEEDMKFIKKNGNKYEIYKTINGIRKFYGSFDNLFDAQNRRNELIGDNWGYSTDELPAPGRKPKYGKYIISHNGFYKICKFVDGQQRYIGKFDSLEDAKEMREYLIKNHWDLSLLPEEMLDDKRIHNIRKIKGRYIVVNTIDGVKKYYDSFDTYEEAKEYLDYLIENNWKVNEDIEEEKIDEFVYLINGKYVVRNEIDGKQKVYGEFDDMDEALQYRIECMRKAWKL